MKYGKLSSSDLADVINLAQFLESGYEELRAKYASTPEKLTPPGYIKPSWYEFYEMPFPQHIAHVVLYTDQVQDLKSFLASENPTKAAIEYAKAQVSIEDDTPLDDAERLLLALVFGWGTSLRNSFKSLLTFGCYLNDLVAKAGEESKLSDKALFQAVRIDPTVVACSRIASRISLAVLRGDDNFLHKLRKAITGKLTKREQESYQNQRLVLQILHETGAISLNQAELYKLFVEQLKIVSGKTSGDVANNLRQFAYQFMKQKSVSKN